jgi:hypothetical protein
VNRHRPTRLPLATLGLILLAATAPAADHFEKHVRPLLVDKCIGCHGPAKQKGGLRLDTKAGWQAGGDSGPAVKPGKPDDSLLVKAVLGKGGLKQMPPEGKLTESEVAGLKKWIADGAADPRDGGPAKLGGTTVEEAKKWWSFQPVRAPSVPKVAGDKQQVANPIDAFVSAKIAGKGLLLSPRADKRTLLRRVTYDLTGRPPTPEEVDAFLKDDTAGAYEKVVDRLLKSPEYGERWGRHWLDLVRYADTAGETSDHPLPHAWRYRNWVIDAFNRDQPYDQFVREQLAGDLLAAKGPADQYAGRVTATGFLAVARRFDFDITKSMHLTHEDVIDTVGKALLGLTLGCARCHDHKYDAVSARDYYALYGILESTRFAFPGCEHTQQPRDMSPLVPPAEWERVVKPYQQKLAKLDATIAAAATEQQKHAQALQAEFVTARRVLSTGEIADSGEKAFDGGAEVAVKAGEVIYLSITPLKNHGADTTLTELQIAEVGGAKRVWNATNDLVPDLLAGNPHADAHGNKQVWWLIDARDRPTLLPEAVKDLNGKAGLHVWRNGDTPSAVVNSTDKEIAAWTKLPAKSLFLHPAPNGNVGLVWLSPVSGKVTIKGRVKDAHPGGPDGVGWVLEHFTVDVRKPMFAQAAEAEKAQALAREKAELLKTAPKQEVAYAVTEGKPADAKLHLRGDPEKPGDVVPRRWLEVFGGTPLKDPTASGRLELADWIASKDNPLFARVMVNRIWLHHFGKGLVKTPNDFGTRGTPPTHPELLDWLAAEFVRGGWSVKALHKLILLSATYQQSAAARPDALKADPNNDLYWRFDRRRLTAEELRDSLLSVSGQLDRTPGEAHPFPPESAWGYTQHTPFGTFFDTDKRSVYLIQVRNRRHPFLGLFDGADPNATTPQRQTTTVPTQALYFMNDPFFHAQAERLAGRVLAKPAEGRVSELFRAALLRTPTEKDREFAESFLAKYRNTVGGTDADKDKAAWSALARVLLASNEFLFVE